MKFKYSAPSSKHLILSYLAMYLEMAVVMFSYCDFMSDQYTDRFHWRDPTPTDLIQLLAQVFEYLLLVWFNVKSTHKY